MNWTLEQLKAFIAAAETGSFSAAARQRGKAQSRISTAIANLEVDLGFELFDRRAKLPVLTKAGEAMLIDAKAILSQCQRMNTRAMAMTAGCPLHFCIAMDEAVPIPLFERLFMMLGEKFPDLSVTILNGSQDDIATWVEEGKADIGFIYRIKPLADVFDYYDLLTVKQVLIAPEAHPLSKLSNLSEDDLVKHRQLVIRDRLGLSQEAPLSPSFWHIDSYYQITTLVARGIGWAFVPEHLVDLNWIGGGICVLSSYKLSSKPILTLSAIKHKARNWDEVLLWFDETLATLLTDVK